MLSLFPSLDAGSPVNRSHPCNRGLVAWYLAGAAGHPSYFGGGRALDLCGRFHGTVTNATWDGPRGRRGGRGSLNFNGTSARVEIGDAAPLDLGTGDVTITCWVKLTGNDGSFRSFVTKYDEVDIAWAFQLCDATRSFAIGAGIEGSLLFNTRDQAIGYDAVAIDDDLWHHCGFGRRTINSDTTHDLWLDGKLVQTGTMTVQDLSGSAALWLGALAYTGGLQWTAGLIDDVRIQSAYVSIAEIYRESLLGYPSMLNRVRRGLLVNSAAAPPAGGGFKPYYDRGTIHVGRPLQVM